MKFWKKLLFICLILTNNSYSQPAILLDKISAIVGNKIILESDIKDTMLIIKKFYQNKDSKFEDIKFLKEKIIEKMILNDIILQSTLNKGIKISDTEINKILKKILLLNHINNKYWKYFLNKNQIKQEFVQNKIMEDIIYSKIKNKEIEKYFIITPEEIKSMSEKIFFQNQSNIKLNLSQLFIPLPENVTINEIHKAQNIANKILSLLKKNISFKEIKDYIILPNNLSIKIENLGWKKYGDIPYIFLPALKEKYVGKITEPIHSNIGIHILKINNIDNTENYQRKPLLKEFCLKQIVMNSSVLFDNNKIYHILKNIKNKIDKGMITFDKAANIIQDIIQPYKGECWVSIELLDPKTKNIVTKMKKGEISKPFLTVNGWNLIQLIDTKNIDFSTKIINNQAYYLVYNDKLIGQENNWINKQLSSIYIKKL